MADILKVCDSYIKRGWVIHRLSSPKAGGASPGKKPIDTGWQTITEPPTEAKLKQWFGGGNPNGYNVGLLCGSASGVTVIDLDRMIYADIFNGVNTLRSSRTAGRGHVYFKYNPRLKASKHHNLGIEVLANGNNAVLPPSAHESGDTYQWDGPTAPIAEMPKEIETKLINLFKREKDLAALVRRCRPCFKRLFKTEVRKATDFHGAEGRELMVAWGADLKAAGATIADGTMWAEIIYGGEFDRAKTLTEWRNIDEKKTWQCETVAAKLGNVIDCDCAGCKWKAPATTAAPETPKPEPNQTDRLIELGKQDAVLFHTPDKTCYAAVKLETGGSAIYPVSEKGTQFKLILKHRFYRTTGKSTASEPMKAALGTLQSIAMFEGEIHDLHNRVAWHNGNICYDLTNANFEAIEITSQGWGVMPHGHVIFRRFGHQIPQVQPVSGGDVWRLYEFVNIPESDQLLDMVHLMSCMVPGIPHPIPITTGEHGSTKTTACKMKKALIDPSDLDVIALQPNEERMVQLMYHHWFVIFDNVTYLQQWQSDMLCRACTGEGTVKRTLYTNEDDTIFKYKRCIGLNGINNAATKPDLLDRAIFLNHEPIPKDRRIEEKVLFERFNEVKPEILGGMFDVLSEALRIYPTIELKKKPRMADFTVWGCAIAEALGRTKEEFLKAYYANIGRINRTALEESPVGLCLISLMATRESWEGSPTKLYNELEMFASVHSVDVKSKFWVKTPRALGKRLRLILPNLREVGIMVEMVRTSDGREYRIVNRLYNETKTTQTTQTSQHSVFDEKSNDMKRHKRHDKRHETASVNEGTGSQTTQNHSNDMKRHGQNQQQEASQCRYDVCDVSATSSNTAGVCGKCGCELSGQTFRGPAGLGLICAGCQSELDRTSGLGETTEENLNTLIKAAIFKLGYVRGIHEFNAVEVFMELPKGTGATKEKIEAHLNDHAEDLKIESMGGGMWRQASA